MTPLLIYGNINVNDEEGTVTERAPHKSGRRIRELKMGDKNYLQDILGRFTNLQDTLEGYMMIFILVGIVFCLLNCLFGYKLRKFWSAMLVFLISGAIVLAAGSFFMDNKTGAVITALVAGLLLAILSVYVYWIALFVACVGLTYGVLALLIPDPIVPVKVIFVIVGVIVGRMVLRFERPLVIAITGICGGFGASKLLFLLLDKDMAKPMLIGGLVASAAGIVLQCLTTGTEKEEKEEFEERTAAGKKKKRKKKKKPVEKSVFQLLRESMQGEEEEPEEYYEEEGEDDWEEPPRRNRNRSSMNAYDELLDMDDINSEMSREIRQIYQEKNKRK